MLAKFKNHFYDSHPKLPLDPDSDQFKIVRPIHTDTAHVFIVGIGAFFGTFARYEIGAWIPPDKNGWPTATLLINVAGAFLLGLLLQTLLHRGKDEGTRRILRLVLGTGFLGAFTTYSSLATSVVILARGGEVLLAGLYGAVSVILGIVAGFVGIQLASIQHRHRNWSVK